MNMGCEMDKYQPVGSNTPCMRNARVRSIHAECTLTEHWACNARAMHAAVNQGNLEGNVGKACMAPAAPYELQAVLCGECAAMHGVTLFSCSCSTILGSGYPSWKCVSYI
jgi:hypothetical protein